MKRTVTPAQNRALSALRGLPSEAHLLLMCASTSANGGGALSGPKQAFDELIQHISEDLSVGIHDASTEAHLVAVCLKIDPRCEDWLGM